MPGVSITFQHNMLTSYQDQVHMSNGSRAHYLTMISSLLRYLINFGFVHVRENTNEMQNPEV